MSRGSSEAQRLALKAAFRRLVVLCGGIDAAAAGTRLARSHLSRLGDVHGTDQPPADVVMDLEFAAGDPVVTQVLAAAQGFALMPVVLGEGDIAASLQEVAVDAGRTMADAMRALADNLPEAEREIVKQDLAKLIRAANVAMGFLQKAGERAAPAILSGAILSGLRA